jgi:hypothetical protein
MTRRTVGWLARRLLGLACALRAMAAAPAERVSRLGF